MSRTLTELLNEPVGRATLLEPDAERQLCGQNGTAANQLARLFDQVGVNLTELLGTRPDLPPRKPHPWTLLTEHEHPGWPMLALAHPSVIPAQAARRVILHLGTAHVVMEVRNIHAWARERHDRSGHEPLLDQLPPEQQGRWLGLISVLLAVQARHAALHTWGVLSAFVGLERRLKVQSVLEVLQSLQGQPELLYQPAELANMTLWATLRPLHGGLPRPASRDAVTHLARALRQLPAQTTTQPLPSPGRWQEQLLGILPALAPAQFEWIAGHAYGKVPSDTAQALQLGSGVPIQQVLGQVAYFFQRAGMVQLVTATQTHSQDALEVHAWHWQR